MAADTPAFARSADGTRIAYEAVGDGPPLVVVGGALSTRAAARDFLDALSGKFRTAVYDRRGRGDSGDTQPYAPERELEDLRAIIDSLGGTAFVHGHSSGGALALDAVAAGLPITKLSVYEPPFVTDDSRPPIPDDIAANVARLVEAGRRGDAVEAFMRDGLLMPDPVIEGARRGPAWSSMESLAHTLPYDFAVLGSRTSGRPLPASMADAITIPVLVLEGDQSPPWMRNTVAALEALLPNAEKRTIAGFGHGAPGPVLAPILTAFFDGESG